MGGKPPAQNFQKKNPGMQYYSFNPTRNTEYNTLIQNITLKNTTLTKQ